MTIVGVVGMIMAIVSIVVREASSSQVFSRAHTAHAPPPHRV